MRMTTDAKQLIRETHNRSIILALGRDNKRFAAYLGRDNNAQILCVRNAIAGEKMDF